MKVIEIDRGDFLCQPSVGELLGALTRHHEGRSLTKDSITGHGTNTWVVCFTAHDTANKTAEKRVAVIKWTKEEAGTLRVTQNIIA